MCLISTLACGFLNRSDNNSSNLSASNSNSNVNSVANISPTPEPTSNLPKYTAQKLAEFLRAEYQKSGGKGDPTAGLKDKEIEITGNVSFVDAGKVEFSNGISICKGFSSKR